MHRRAASALTAVAIVCVPLAAGAICGRMPPVVVRPYDGVDTPTNARVTITMPKDFRRDATIVLKRAPMHGRARAEVGASSTTWRTADFERLVLAPRALLDPYTDYEVWTSRGEILGAFTTSDAPDRVAPRWVGVKSARVARPAGHVIQPECGAPRVSVESDAPASDDRTPERDLLYAIWIEPAKDRIDYLTPPRSWISATADDRRRLLLFYGNAEYDDDVDLPTASAVRVGVRVFDLAGNATEPSEVIAK